MTRSAIRDGLAACLATLVAAAFIFNASARAQQRPVFRAGANFVTVDAYPRRDDHVVEGLQAADFDVLEDGKPQKIEQFDFVRVEHGVPDAARREPNTQEEGNQLAADPRNRVFVVYLDKYHVNIDGAHRMRKPMGDFLNRLLAPNDLFGVMTPTMRPKDLILGRKTLTIEDELTKHWAWGQQPMSMQDLPLEPEESAIAMCYGYLGAPTSEVPYMRLYVDRRREDITLTNLEALVKYLGTIKEGRKTVIVFTRGWAVFPPDTATMNLIRNGQGNPIPSVRMAPDGRMTTGRNSMGGPDRAACDTELSRVFTLDDRVRMRDILAAAKEMNVTFDMVNPAGLEAADVMGRDMTGTMALGMQQGRADSMRTLADNTDGVTIIENHEFGAGLNRLAEDSSAYYLLGYYSTNTKFDGKFRQIDVKVKSPSVMVSARRGYLALKESDRSASPASVVATGAADLARVTEAFGVLSRLGPSSEVYTYGAATPTDLQVNVEIGGTQIELGKWAKGADVQATVTSAIGDARGIVRGRIDPGARGASLRLPLSSIGTGPWHVNVTVTGEGTSLGDRVEVQPRTGSLLGEPFVFRATPAARSPLRPVADFQFRRTERLHVEWPVLVALDRREARLLDRKGQPMAIAANVTEREESPGHTWLASDVNLAPLGEGDYCIEVTAGSGAETVRRIVAFRVVR